MKSITEYVVLQLFELCTAVQMQAGLSGNLLRLILLLLSADDLGQGFWVDVLSLELEDLTTRLGQEGFPKCGGQPHLSTGTRAHSSASVRTRRPSDVA